MRNRNDMRVDTQNTRGGFSLIEVLVYLAVTLLVASAGVVTYLSLDSVLVRNVTYRELNHSATVALERLGSEIRKAISVNTIASTFDTSPGELTLVYGTTTAHFGVVNGRLILTMNGVEVGPLTSDDVSVDSFIVNQYVGTSTDLIRVALTLSGSSKAASTTETYYTSAVIRGTYD